MKYPKDHDQSKDWYLNIYMFTFILKMFLIFIFWFIVYFCDFTKIAGRWPETTNDNNKKNIYNNKDQIY